jgi:hypothetical protein
VADARSIVVADANGQNTILLVRTLTGAASIQTGLLACTQADWLRWWESGITTNGGFAPSGGVNRSVNQRAALVFVCADTTQVALIIPAPSAAIFMADGETVDPSVTAVATLIGSCLGNLVNNAGSPATTYVSGALLPGARSPL